MLRTVHIHLALVATTICLASCGEDSLTPSPVQQLHPVPAATAATASPSAGPQQRGAAMLKRELTYLSAMVGRKDRTVTVAVSQLVRTLNWYDRRELPVPTSIQSLRPSIDLVISDGPAPPAEAPSEPVYVEPEHVGARKTDGIYKGPYHGGVGKGFIVLCRGEYIIMRAVLDGDVRRGTPVSGYGAPTNAYATQTVDGKPRQMDIYFYASKEEFEEDSAKHEERREKSKTAHAQALVEYEAALTIHREVVEDYNKQLQSFPARKSAALASLPALAGQAAATL